MKRLLFIVNPCAGMKRVVRFLPGIIDLFRHYGYENTVYMTDGRGDGTALAINRGADFDLIVCAGGDGTFNEVMTGVLSAGLTVPLGYIPCGSTNDFASSLHLPKTIPEAARFIMDGTPCPVDVGSFGSRYFSYVASFGAFTRTSYTTPQNIKNSLGHLAYLLSGIKDIPTIRPVHVRFEVENLVLEDDYIFGAISNTTSVGGVLTLDSRLVDLNDGLFELILIKSPKDIIELNECIRALTAQDYASRMITFLSASKIHITCPTPLDWTLDGECASHVTEVDVENLHSAISLCRVEAHE